MKDREYQRLAMKIFADFSVSIAVPAVVGALFGKWLDTRYGTAPWFMITCLAIALVLTGFVIVRKAKQYAKAYTQIEDENPPSLS